MLRIFGLLLGLQVSMASAQTLFLGEKGNYRYSQQDVVWHVLHGQNYLDFDERLARPDMRYKLEGPRNEFKARNWYSYDWFLLQNMFSLDVPDFLNAYGASSFNEAKRRQYAQFPFDKKKFLHHKGVAAMREWGGLTHPPVKQLDHPLEVYDRNFASLNYNYINSRYFDPDLQESIDRASLSELTFGNGLKVLVDRHAFVAKKALIRKAQESILMSSLVFVCDESTREIVDLLIQKHRAGVKVRVMVDGMISRLLKHRECPRLLRQAGIEVIETKDFFKYNRKAIYHTKTLVVGDEAIAGGHNMIDADNTSRGTDFQNRDIDLYVKGPLVTDIARQFAENWQHQLKFFKSKHRPSSMANELREIYARMENERRLGQRGSEHYDRVLGSPLTRMDGVCRFIKQAPYEDRHTVGKAYLILLNHLKHHLVIEDPVKTDTDTAKKRPGLLDRFDDFSMFNLLHRKVQELARAGKKIDYITTNIDMAGNENVAILNDLIREQLEDGEALRANWSLFKIKASNQFFGKPHYRNLLNDWLPFPNVHIWTHISFMHSKVFYFDRLVASIGSVNFQHNATDQAYESTSICMDEELNKQLDEVLVLDMANSIPLIFSRLK